MRTLLPTLAAIAIAAVLVLAIEPLRVATGHALHGDVDALQAELESLGVWGALVLVSLILVHAVVLFPAEIPNAVAGLVYGFGIALPMVMAAWTASGLIAYYLGVWIGRPLAVRLAGEERVESAERVIGKGGIAALLLARLIPFVPFSLVGYIAGATRVSVWRYTWTSAVGVLPITAAATYLGHALDDFSLSDPLVWVAGGALVVLIVLTIPVARRMHKSNR
ncbi:VTT domain-containing protein [Solirubrobacter sp. CPCC 204708]|uniref:TVP38/TMEM64 family membrane protein n=1 Tax=Solirubrobacter deserti TaxID=2282478 RepID=A0ABT4RMX2_9ACTN|nr:VTT domain-containing protein [Solirubrobacter deserti]MBE2320142.1 VTT domain-containing protein [Solirubrobacter deserti]MDA0139862.1 VTT domain-containing protein [Solirubrobacter deserti]